MPRATELLQWSAVGLQNAFGRPCMARSFLVVSPTRWVTGSRGPLRKQEIIVKPGGQAPTKEEIDKFMKQKRRCLRIVGFDKEEGEYYRCNKAFTHETNTPTSCKFHEVGLFDRFGPGNWWNCCKKTDPDEIGCLTWYCSDEVDDSELRGHSKDPKTPAEVKMLYLLDEHKTSA